MTFKKFKTEKILLASIVVLSLFVFVNAFSQKIGTKVSSAQGASEQESQKSSPSSDEPSEPSVKSSPNSDEPSEPSAASVPSVKKTRTTQDTGSGAEVSEKSTQEISQQSVKEASEASVLSEKSQEISEESIKYVEGYGDVVSKEGNVALVKKDEKLFFLIPVEVESQVTLDEQGSVVDEKKSFLNWLLSAFSF